MLSAISSFGKNITSKTNPPPFEYRTHNIGNLWSRTSNFGNYGDPNADALGTSSCEWPGGSGNNYLWEGRLWIGAVANGDTLVTHADYGNYEWAPTEGTEFLFGESVPDPKSMQDSYVIYDDTSDIYNQTPLGLKVIQRGLTWNIRDYNNFIAYEYEIVNIGSNDLDELYVSWNFDADVSSADDCSPHIDDKVGYDSSRGMSYMWDGVNPNEPGDDMGDFNYQTLQLKSPGYIGQRLLYTPFGSPSSHYWWDWANDPETDDHKYIYMSSGQFLSEPTEVFDYRWLLSTGPFSLAPEETLRLVMGEVVGNGLKGLQEHADRMMEAYESGWTSAFCEFTFDTNLPSIFSLNPQYPL